VAIAFVLRAVNWAIQRTPRRKALARASTGLLGLVVPDIGDPYFSSIARGVQIAARAAGEQVLLASTDRDFDIDAQRCAP